jgi:hypothetical protein
MLVAPLSPDPASLEEYTERFTENLRVVRRGGSLEVRAPCPFCAAPEFWSTDLEQLKHDSRSIYCIVCERSALYRFADGKAEILHIGGPAVPSWSSIKSTQPEHATTSEGELSSSVVQPHPRRLPRGRTKAPRKTARKRAPRPKK